MFTFKREAKVIQGKIVIFTAYHFNLHLHLFFTDIYTYQRGFGEIKIKARTLEKVCNHLPPIKQRRTITKTNDDLIVHIL